MTDIPSRMRVGKILAFASDDRVLASCKIDLVHSRQRYKEHDCLELEG